MTNQRKKPPYTHAGGGGEDKPLKDFEQNTFIIYINLLILDKRKLKDEVYRVDANYLF